MLQFRFDANYPISSPAVQFVVEEGRHAAPVHPVSAAAGAGTRANALSQHVYSNGHVSGRGVVG